MVAKSLKRKYGKSVLIKFYPLLGALHYEKIGIQKYYDAIRPNLDDLNKNPETKIIVSNLGFQPFILVVDPKVAKDLSVYYGTHYRFLEGSLMLVALFQDKMSFGEKRKKERKMWAKAFEYQHIENYTQILRRSMHEQMKSLDKECQNSGGKSFNPKIYMGLQSVVCKVILEGFWNVSNKISDVQVGGLPISSQVTKIFIDSADYMKTHPFYLLKMKIFQENAPFYFQTKEEKSILKRADEVREVCIKEIEIRLKEFKEGNRKQDQLDIFLENYLSPESNPLKALRSIKDIFAQFMSFFLAGTHTASFFGTLGLQLLAHLQEEQNEVRKEIQNYVKKTGKKVEEFSISDLNQLEILDLFSKEFHRYNGSQKTMFQECLTENTIDGFEIKKGWLVQVGVGELARQEKFWENASQFNMYRWRDMKTKDSKPFDTFTYIPFWAGPRNCIGQHLAVIELKYIWLTILSKYRISLPDDEPFERYKHLDENLKHIRFTPL